MFYLNNMLTLVAESLEDEKKMADRIRGVYKNLYILPNHMST